MAVEAESFRPVQGLNQGPVWRGATVMTGRSAGNHLPEARTSNSEGSSPTASTRAGFSWLISGR